MKLESKEKTEMYIFKKMSRSLLYTVFFGTVLHQSVITMAIRISDCNSCLQHCNIMTPNRHNENICRSCLSYCRERVDDLLHFFRSRQCFTPQEISNLMETASTQRRDARVTAAQGCERFHVETVRSFTEFLIKYYICSSDLEAEKEKNENCSPMVTEPPGAVDDSEDDIARLYRENKNIFMNENDIQRAIQLNQRIHDHSREATLRSREITMDEEEQAVCPTVHEPISPTSVRRKSERGEMVRLVTYNGQKQFFHSGRCLQNTTLTTMNPPGRCKTVHHSHQAIFKLTNVRYNRNDKKFEGCYRPRRRSSTTVICKDWVLIESSCAFVIRV